MALRYLTYDEACFVVAVARSEAAAVGAPRRAPPRPLEECDRGVVESALFAPQQELIGVGEAFPSLPEKAAVLLYALAKSQACVDGNKRLALLLVIEFLSLNGAELTADEDAIVDKILAVAASETRLRDQMRLELTTWFEQHVAPIGEA